MRNTGAEKEISRPQAPPPLPSSPDKESQEIDARTEAAKMARKIGDEEWKKGNTKYAFEAYEASDITASELLEMAQRLFKAADLCLEWADAGEATQRLPSTHERGVYCAIDSRSPCIRCRVRTETIEEFRQRIRSLLGWNKNTTIPGWGATDGGSCFMKAAAVACLKLIKRMR